MFMSYYFNFLNLVVVFCLIIHMPLTDWVTDFSQLLLLFVYFLVSTCHFFSSYRHGHKDVLVQGALQSGSYESILEVGSLSFRLASTL